MLVYKNLIYVSVVKVSGPDLGTARVNSRKQTLMLLQTLSGEVLSKTGRETYFSSRGAGRAPSLNVFLISLKFTQFSLH